MLQASILSRSGAHPTSYPMGTRDSFPGGKWLGHEADNSPPPSLKVKNVWCCTSIAPYIFMALCLVKYRICHDVELS